MPVQLTGTQAGNQIKMPLAGQSFGVPDSKALNEQIAKQARDGTLQKMTDNDVIAMGPRVPGYNPMPAFETPKIPSLPNTGSMMPQPQEPMPADMPLLASNNNVGIKTPSPAPQPQEEEGFLESLPKKFATMRQSLDKTLTEADDEVKMAKQSMMDKTKEIVMGLREAHPDKTGSMNDAQIMDRFFKMNPQAQNELFADELAVFTKKKQQGLITKAGQILAQKNAKVDTGYNPVQILAKGAKGLIAGGIEGAGYIQDVGEDYLKKGIMGYQEATGQKVDKFLDTGRTHGQNLTDVTAGAIQLGTTILPVARAGNMAKAVAQMAGVGAILNTEMPSWMGPLEGTSIGKLIYKIGEGGTNSFDFVLDQVPLWKEFQETIPQDSKQYFQQAFGSLLAGQLLNTRIVKGKNAKETVKLTVQNSLKGKNIRNNFKEQFDNVQRGAFGDESVMSRSIGAIGDTVSGAIKLASGKYNIMQKAGKFAESAGETIGAKITGQNRDDFVFGSKNKDITDQAIEGTISEESIANKLDSIVRDMDESRYEAGSAYETLYGSTNKISGDDISTNANIKLASLGIEVNDKGRIVVDPTTYVAKDNEVGQIQKAYNILKTIGSKDLTVEQAHNVRKSIDQLITYGDVNKKQSEAVRAIRDLVDEKLKKEVEGWKEVDDTYKQSSREVQELIKEFFKKDPDNKYTIKQEVFNKLKGSMNDPQFSKRLEKLEKVIPGAGDQIRAIKYAKDFQHSRSNKPGGYMKSALSMAGAGLGFIGSGVSGGLLGGAGMLFTTALTDPAVLMPIIQKLRKQDPQLLKDWDKGIIRDRVKQLLLTTAKKVYEQNKSNKQAKEQQNIQNLKKKTQAPQQSGLPYKKPADMTVTPEGFVTKDGANALEKEAKYKIAKDIDTKLQSGELKKSNNIRKDGEYFTKEGKATVVSPTETGSGIYNRGKLGMIEVNGKKYMEGEIEIFEKATKPESPIKVPKQEAPTPAKEVDDFEALLASEQNKPSTPIKVPKAEGDDRKATELRKINKLDAKEGLRKSIKNIEDQVSKLEAMEQRIGKVGNNKVNKEYSTKQFKDIEKSKERIIEKISQEMNLDANEAYDMYQKIASKSPRTKYQAKEQLGALDNNHTTYDLAKEELKNYFDEGEVPSRFRENITTPRGQEAYGAYAEGGIDLVQYPHRTTASHESVHAYFDLFTSAERKRATLDQIKKEHNLKTDLDAEEHLADGFYDYINNRPTNLSGKIKSFFRDVREGMKSVFGKQDRSRELYNRILKKDRSEIQKIKVPGKNEKVTFQSYGETDKYTIQPILDIRKEIKGDAIKRTTLESMMNRQSYKGPERQAIQDILDNNKNETIPTQDVINQLKESIMPLKQVDSSSYAVFNRLYTPKDGKTIIYQTPFYTTLDNHFQNENYFSHVRIEGDSKNKTLMELQSDLMQNKGYEIRNMDAEINGDMIMSRIRNNSNNTKYDMNAIEEIKSFQKENNTKNITLKQLAQAWNFESGDNIDISLKQIGIELSDETLLSKSTKIGTYKN